MGIFEIVADGQLLVASLIAIAAGLVSFLSPCILPLVPGYLAYASASAGAAPGETPSRRRLVLGAALFVAGFTAVLVTFLAAAGSVGIWLIEWEPIITRVMGVFVILMGLVFMGVFSRAQNTRKLKLKPKLGLAGAPVLGAVFAVGWTPCMGPTLTVIMGLSLQQGSIGRSVVLALMYCLGLGLPFVLAAFGFGWMTQTMTFFKRHIRAVNLIGGGLLILIGLLMVTGLWSKMMFALQAVIDGYVTPL
ncbi:cytochrome c biogenesis CcdA family protein [Leucobacter sp. PH1c]|uniref:cytochrome c biogenesis CcdA family protein n=1 Tax=Leucobacter sp. PH1c TaxID=1397278 RepID=UPI00046A2FD1|nr:cytochrome c biogenesis CcdA family protein [Leucobacter sp. PH1c]